MTLAKVLFALTISAGSLVAGDWSRFRGPNGTGVVEGQVPLKCDPKEATWKTKLPGIGHGSPIVVNDKVFLQTSGDDQSRSLVCVDAKSGKLDWTKVVSPGIKPQQIHKKNSGASSTPTSDGQSVYLSVWDGKVVAIFAYDLTGKELWKRPIGDYVGQHGAAHSPMVHDGIVYFSFDDDVQAKFYALDAKTGEVKWSKERKKERACYSIPIVLEKAGKTAIVIGTTTGIDAYDPKTGNSVWTYPINWTATGVKPLRAIGQPLLADGTFYTYFGEGGSGRYMVAVKTDGTGDVSAKGKVWDSKEKDKTPYVPSLIASKDHVYWVNDTGFAACANAKTGKIVWYERVFPKAVSASPILVGDTILAIDETGKAVAFKASAKGLEEVNSSTLGEAVFASPAASNGRLIIRGTEHLFGFAGKGS